MSTKGTKLFVPVLNHDGHKGHEGLRTCSLLCVVALVCGCSSATPPRKADVSLAASRGLCLAQLQSGRVDLARMRGGGRGFRIPANLESGDVSGRVAPDGTWAAAQQRGEGTGRLDAIVGVRLDGQELWRVEAARPESPAISPDGTQVAFAASDELQVYDISSRALRVLGLRGHHPAWAHDATRLAYDDGRQVYVYDFRTQKTSIAGPGTDPSWSTDGVTLAVRASFNEVDMINTRDRRRQALLQKREVRMPQWSPDGEWMAYSYLGQGSLFPLTIEPHPIVIRNVQTGDEVEVDSYSKAFPGDYVWIRNVDLCAA